MVDSRVAVDSLIEVDPGFVTLCKALLGDSVDAVEAWQFIYGPERVVKMGPDPSEVSTFGGRVKGALKTKRGKLVSVAAAVGTGAVADRAYSRHRQSKVHDEILNKDDSTDIIWMGEFSKVDGEKRQVFGYASIVEIDGEPVIDRQGDYISADEIEKAAYQYVQNSRKGGHQHKRDGDGPFHASNMIESFVITPEKIEKMGLPSDTPVGWWVGYKVEDEETWAKVKKGEVTGFSIHGKGKRQEIDARELLGV